MKDGDSSNRVYSVDALQKFSAQDLLKLGIDDVGYVKRYRMQGEIVWVLHAADGAALAAKKTPDEAWGEAINHDIDIVAVH